MWEVVYFRRISANIPPPPITNIPQAGDYYCRGTESSAANLKHSRPDKVGEPSFHLFFVKQQKLPRLSQIYDSWLVLVMPMSHSNHLTLI
jgi:hypothetical protein